MDLGHYILDGHAVVHIPMDCDGDRAVYMAALLRWGRWLEEHRAEMIVGRTCVGDYEIATDFLGLDHGSALFGGRGGPPIVFGTMVFSGFRRKGIVGQMERCSTWEQAEAQHARAVAAVRRMVSS